MSEAYTTVSADLAAKFPTLKNKIGKTITFSELRRVKNGEKLGATKAEKAPTVKPVAAKKVAPKKRTAKKVVAKK